MQLIITHKIGKLEAKSIIKDKIHEFITLGNREIKNLKQIWEGDTLNFSFSSNGLAFYGETIISDDLISIKINMPFALRFYESQLKSKIETKLTSILLKE